MCTSANGSDGCLYSRQGSLPRAEGIGCPRAARSSTMPLASGHKSEHFVVVYLAMSALECTQVRQQIQGMGSRLDGSECWLWPLCGGLVSG